MNERLQKAIDDALMQPAFTEYMRETIAWELYKRSLARAWPELFDGVDVSAETPKSMWDKITDYVLYADGTGIPRGIVSSVSK
jgi:hypothetical protein